MKEFKQENREMKTLIKIWQSLYFKELSSKKDLLTQIGDHLRGELDSIEG